MLGYRWDFDSTEEPLDVPDKKRARRPHHLAEADRMATHGLIQEMIALEDTPAGEPP